MYFFRKDPPPRLIAVKSPVMPPYLEKDYDGYWGRPTATIDWCESNYEVTPYVAEFCKSTAYYIYQLQLSSHTSYVIFTNPIVY